MAESAQSSLGQQREYMILGVCAPMGKPCRVRWVFYFARINTHYVSQAMKMGTVKAAFLSRINCPGFAVTEKRAQYTDVVYHDFGI